MEINIDIIIRLAAVALAVALIVSTIDFVAIFKKSISWFKWPTKNKVEVAKEIQFLEIVNLWHKLKSSCEQYGLEEATEKLDEVFPLLNVEK